jgi:hypothetical protein
MEKQNENNYKIRRTYTNDKGILCCDYIGEWGEDVIKLALRKELI